MKRLGFGLPRNHACIEEANLHQDRFADIRAWRKFADCNRIKSRQNSLILGPAGLGKTYIASALVFRAIECGYSAWYVNEPGLLFRPETKPKQLRQISEANLLIIDEFEPACMTEAEQDSLIMLVSARNGFSSTVLVTRSPIPDWKLRPRQVHSYDDFLMSALILELRNLPCRR